MHPAVVIRASKEPLDETGAAQQRNPSLDGVAARAPAAARMAMPLTPA